MAKINLKKATINEERVKAATIEECLYFIIMEIGLEDKDIEIDTKESVA